MQSIWEVLPLKPSEPAFFFVSSKGESAPFDGIEVKGIQERFSLDRRKQFSLNFVLHYRANRNSNKIIDFDWFGALLFVT